MPRRTRPCGPRSTPPSTRRMRPMLEAPVFPAGESPGPASPQQAMDGFLADFARQNPDLAWFAQLVAMQRQAAATAQTPPPELEAARAELETMAEQLRRSEARAEKF